MRPGLLCGLRMSFDEVVRFKLARLPKLKLGLEGVFEGDAGPVPAAEPVGLPGADDSDIEGRLAESASESKNSTNRFEKDYRRRR